MAKNNIFWFDSPNEPAVEYGVHDSQFNFFFLILEHCVLPTA